MIVRVPSGVPVVALAAVLAGACHSSTKTIGETTSSAALEPPPALGLQPVLLPDFSSMQPSVRKQMEQQLSTLRSAIEMHASTRTELANAYGEMGKLLMAAAFLDAAEGCYLNAQTLSPGDQHWPYYLGHLYKAKGPPEKSVASFERARQLATDDFATTVALGEAYLAAGRPDAADEQFAAAVARRPSAAAARLGAGRAALARRDYARAVEQLTQALSLEPQASAIHYPLAMAYRGLGDIKQSEAHLAQQGKVDPRPFDPLMRELDALLESPEAYSLRGGAELEAGRWQAAVDQFRRGVELAPNEPSLRHRLGTALYQMGDPQAAAREFEEVLRRTPDYARAHFSLGVLLNDAHRYPEAIDHFRAALKSEPHYVEAREQLAGALARSGHPGEAVGEYTQALDADPNNFDAAFGRAMAFVRLKRYVDARDAFSAGMKSHPDQPMFAHALARLLAAAPEDSVRNGRQALNLVDQLAKGQQSIELAETTAMALAELGRYQEAIAVQLDALTGARNIAPPAVEHRIAGNLRLYEKRRPCRVPFGDDELP